MQAEQFEIYLRTRPVSKAARENAMSRCRRVERYQGDLDEHYRLDNMSALLSRLEYSAEDERLKRPPRHKVFMAPHANKRTGTASLASAIRRYLEFAANPARNDDYVRLGMTREKSLSWPTWDAPGEDAVLEMARTSARYIKFLNPEIVRAIVEDNELNRVTWEARLQELHIDPRLYLWEKSASAFPGVRRYAGSSEIAQFRGRMEKIRPANVTVLDDNSYPKQIWSFIFRGKQFQNYGPAGYSLAHLADHKDYKNRCAQEFIAKDDGPLVHPGLYTSAANVAFMPTALIRPTDFSFGLRNLMQRRAVALYGSFCQLWPKHLSIRDSDGDLWRLDRFEWAEPVGTMQGVAAFLDWRRTRMNELFRNAGSKSVVIPECIGAAPAA